MGNVVMEATQINYRRDEKLKTVDQKLQELSQESAIDTDIAPVFKSNITYHPGDMVYYRNKLYVFTAEHTGAWAAGDVTATDVSTAMNTALAGKADYADIAGAFSAETAYTAGDLVIYNGIIYRCTNDHTGEWDADDFSATTIGAELNAINSNIVNLLKPIGLTKTITLTSDASGTVSIAKSDFVIPSGYELWVWGLNVSVYGSWNVKPVSVRMAYSDGDTILTSNNTLNVDIVGGTSGGDVTYRVSCLSYVYKQ